MSCRATVLPREFQFLKNCSFSGETACELEAICQRWVAFDNEFPHAAWGNSQTDSYKKYTALVQDFQEFAARNGCIEEEVGERHPEIENLARWEAIKTVGGKFPPSWTEFFQWCEQSHIPVGNHNDALSDIQNTWPDLVGDEENESALLTYLRKEHRIAPTAAKKMLLADLAKLMLEAAGHAADKRRGKADTRTTGQEAGKAPIGNDFLPIAPDVPDVGHPKTAGQFPKWCWEKIGWIKDFRTQLSVCGRKDGYAMREFVEIIYQCYVFRRNHGGQSPDSFPRLTTLIDAREKEGSVFYDTPGNVFDEFAAIARDGNGGLRADLFGHDDESGLALFKALDDGERFLSDAAQWANRQAVETTERTANKDAEAQPGSATDRKQAKLEWLAKAMLLVKENPEWPDSDIADEVGVHKGTLSRSPEYQAAADLARAPKKAPTKGHVDIDPVTGKRRGIEAYEDDDAGDADD